MKPRTIEVKIQGGDAWVWLNRPETRNALDEVMIEELTAALLRLSEGDEVRTVILGGRGPAFCAGADLNWMRRMAQFSDTENEADALRLATMLRTLAELPKPVVARVHGHAYAGGLGLVAACDLVVAAETAEFCLSEVRLGLVPATISPYVLRAFGVRAAQRYMLTSERFGASEAFRQGLVHVLCPPENLDSSIANLLAHLRAGGPQALARTKHLIAEVDGKPLDDRLVGLTAKTIADVRSSAEAREGVSAFFEKRGPDWATRQVAS
ncbi:enoyl-CoA hydratase/isomerase family protein [Azospirillum sp. TSO35-2]|uniref:enoyl-CoA hydratase/isomerase family protein n=1 Tax=Azospirillum sp. TSO35-2 TaxID=716796 RepID=UPI000D6092AC|nr:enoyl-CoA hydratase/isomerase family protein [Azospirillum sp. TSO35-2]PWC39517.1 enoyl-CoA hydratase [Azospirillum sp. TSO35-2]